MDYLVFYRTLDSHHIKWGPMWSHRYESVTTELPLETKSDLDYVTNYLKKLHGGKQVEITNLVPQPRA